MPCRFASSGTVATSRSASRAILALNAASNFLRDLVISVLRRLRQSRTLHTLTFGPISGVHFKQSARATAARRCLKEASSKRVSRWTKTEYKAQASDERATYREVHIHQRCKA